MTGAKLREIRKLRNGLIFISPWLAGFLGFTLYPMLRAFYFSFTDYSGLLRPPVFIGFENYRNMFLSDTIFVTVVKNTLFMVFVGGSLIILTTLIIAILLDNKNLKGFAGFRVLFFLPTLVPAIILCILWIWLFNVDSGLINSVLAVFGIRGPGWLASLTWSKPALIIMRTWISGNLIIIFLGGLQDIPRDLYEAADIDGGNLWHKIIHITVPMLKPIILFNVVNTINGLMQMFVEPLTMTSRGGPMDRTYTYALYVYQNAFTYGNMGYACALSWIMLIITMLFTVISLKSGGYFEERENY
ncbi:MAG: sugar ABC transporter permease [Treponema sp.]|jgi:multiple sugar transport system permease protein|nr:sugar ABC transporter permease [Treponema sp.]